MNSNVAEVPATAVVPRAGVLTPIDLLQMAMQQGADLDRLERLLALKREWDAAQAKEAYYAASAACRATPVTIYKAKYVDIPGGAKYWHAELSDVCTAIDQVLAAHGMSYRWNVEQKDKRIFVTCTLRHAGGHEEHITMDGPPDDSGKKNPLQQIQSTVTYLQRHTLLAITGRATKGMDNDGRGADADPADERRRPARPAAPAGAEPSRLVDEGNAEAAKGEAALNEWWKRLTQQQRTDVTPYFAAMKQDARRAGR